MLQRECEEHNSSTNHSPLQFLRSTESHNQHALPHTHHADRAVVIAVFAGGYSRMAAQRDGIPSARYIRCRKVAPAVRRVNPPDLPRKYDSGLELPRHARQVREDGAEHPPEHHRARRGRRRRGERGGQGEGRKEEGEGARRRRGFGDCDDEGGGVAGAGFGGEGGGEAEEHCEEAEEGFEDEDARGFQRGD